MHVPSISIDEMATIDERTITFFGVDLRQLMESAGFKVAAFARERLKGTVAGKTIVILVGKGNNGGDGLVAARYLTNWGAIVHLLVAVRPETLREPGKSHLQTAKNMFINQFYPTQTLPEELEEADLIIDALLGYNGRGAPREPLVTIIKKANETKRPILSVDVPSGIDADTGFVTGACIRATWTLALALPKNGTMAKQAKPFVGELWVADIGIPREVYQLLELPVPMIFEEKLWVKVSGKRI
ncbi:MAG: NAD(P)H-hydrate epimerase [Nanoarchaeota archaeon]|nr:NAD(P)H-hydrate epimerase [Nanoarchaeota archaeon]